MRNSFPKYFFISEKFCNFAYGSYNIKEKLIMNNADFWASIRTIIDEGFTPERLLILDSYAEQFISGKLVYQRFSPQEQHGLLQIIVIVSPPQSFLGRPSFPYSYSAGFPPAPTDRSARSRASWLPHHIAFSRP